MADEYDDDKLRWSRNYDLERYSFGDTDERGNLVWHTGLPSNEDWDRIEIVTVNYDLDGEGHYRNIYVPPGRPLDPLFSDRDFYTGPHKGGRYGPEHYYDLDDLVTEFYWSTNTP